MDVELLEKYALIIERNPIFPRDNVILQWGIAKVMDHRESHKLTTEDGKDVLLRRSREMYGAARDVFKVNLQGKSDLESFFFRAQAGNVVVSLGSIQSQGDEQVCVVTLRVRRGDTFLKKFVLTTIYRCGKNESMRSVVEESVAGYAQRYHVRYTFA